MNSDFLKIEVTIKDLANDVEEEIYRTNSFCAKRVLEKKNCSEGYVVC